MPTPIITEEQERAMSASLDADLQKLGEGDGWVLRVYMNSLSFPAVFFRS